MYRPDGESPAAAIFGKNNFQNYNTMETKRLKVMRGSKEHPELVKKWLEEQGATNSSEWRCNDDDFYYFVVDGLILNEYASRWDWNFIDHEVVELKPKHVFQPFEKVLVRDDVDEEWRCDIFSHTTDYSFGDKYCCVGNLWNQCIPYDGNEHLLGTTDSPKGGK